MFPRARTLSAVALLGALALCGAGESGWHEADDMPVSARWSDDRGTNNAGKVLRVLRVHAREGALSLVAVPPHATVTLRDFEAELIYDVGLTERWVEAGAPPVLIDVTVASKIVVDGKTALATARPSRPCRSRPCFQACVDLVSASGLKVPASADGQSYAVSARFLATPLDQAGAWVVRGSSGWEPDPSKRHRSASGGAHFRGWSRVHFRPVGDQLQRGLLGG